MESEYIYCRLRTKNGIEFSDFSRLFGDKFLSKYSKVCRQLEEAGLLTLLKDSCVLMDKGLLLADHIALEITSGKEK